MNGLANGLLFKGVCEVKLVCSSASMSVVIARIKFPYSNSFIIVNLWTNPFRSIY